MKQTNHISKVAAGLTLIGAVASAPEVKAQDTNAPNVVVTRNVEPEDNPFARLTQAKPKSDSFAEAFEKYVDYARDQAGTNALDSARLSYENGLKQVGKGLAGMATASYSFSEEEREAITENDFKFRASPFVEGGKNLGMIPVYALGTAWSGLDAITFDQVLPPLGFLPASDEEPFGRTFIYMGRMVGSGEKAGMDLANGVSAGLADNFLYPATMTLDGVVATGKHLGQGTLQAATFNRGPAWLTLAPFEWGENVVVGEGFDNMDEYWESFREKGKWGAISETMGSGALTGFNINRTYFSGDETGVIVDDGSGPGTPGGISGGKTGGIGAGASGSKVGGIGAGTP